MKSHPNKNNFPPVPPVQPKVAGGQVDLCVVGDRQPLEHTSAPDGTNLLSGTAETVTRRMEV